MIHLLFLVAMSILLCMSNALRNRCKNVAPEALTTIRDGIVGQWNRDLMQGDQKVSVHLMITIQKVTSNVQSVPRQSPYIY